MLITWLLSIFIRFCVVAVARVGYGVLSGLDLSWHLRNDMVAYHSIYGIHSLLGGALFVPVVGCVGAIGDRNSLSYQFLVFT